MIRVVCILTLALCVLTLAMAVPPEAANEKKGQPTADSIQAAKRAQVPDGLNVDVWAAEPNLANPVAFTFDEKGAAYVVETYRHTDGVTDTRSHMYWLEDDIACRTVADRVAMYKKHKYPAYDKFGEQLRKVWASPGSQVADQSSVFAGPFNKPEDGVAAGVLARKGEVLFACIPDLYVLKDTKGTNTADVKQSLATGFGIHVQFIGHDLHGLIMGPDGKLYMSIGDRGFNITTLEGKKLFNPDSGAVLRCDPDGKNLEVVHVGLRNPQELAFDEHGNLFTYDNNSDSGDRARWVQIVQGGDSGWRCGYQYGTLMHHDGVEQRQNRGPWNTEKLWHLAHPEQPAYVVPPLKHFGNGPSGLAYYPGIGLNPKYKNHFFAVDFTASPVNSTIWTLTTKPKGASFEVSNPEPFVKNMVATDCEFGPDGAFYWLDWTGGWNKPMKGRIFRVTDPEAMKSPRILEAKSLLAEGFDKIKTDDLLQLLEHPHQKIRLEVQYELAKRCQEANGSANNKLIAEITKIATDSKNKLARLHAIWGLCQVGRTFPVYVEVLFGSLDDADADIRIAAAKSLGVAKTTRVNLLGRLQRETDLRVQAEILRVLSQFPVKEAELAEAVLPAFTMLKQNNDVDPHLRQALAEYLVGLGAKPCDLIEALNKLGPAMSTPATRLGLVLALRKLQCPKLGSFLNDPDPRVAAEAARAIYDQELMAAMPELAKVIAPASTATGSYKEMIDAKMKAAKKGGSTDTTVARSEALVYRALAANYRLGDAESLARVVNFAGQVTEPAHLREAAIKLLGTWAKPGRLDPITGLTMDLGERKVNPTEAVKAALPKLLSGPATVRREAVSLIAKLNIQGVGPQLAAIVNDTKQLPQARVEALFAMEAIAAKETKETATKALESDQTKLKAAARAVLIKSDSKAGETIAKLLGESATSVPERQALIGVLGLLNNSKAGDETLVKLLEDLVQGKLPGELQLEVLEAAQLRLAGKGAKLQAPIRETLKKYDDASRAMVGKDPLARFRESLLGGDAEAGRSIVVNNAAVYCVRCHKLDGQGGEVGPVLNGLAAKPGHTREYFLESIVYPNAKIAEGYQSVILDLVDGRTVSGVMREKTAKQYKLVTPDNKVLTIEKDDVEREKPDQSAMPDDLVKKLSKRELRDVVAFLFTLNK